MKKLYFAGLDLSITATGLVVINIEGVILVRTVVSSVKETALGTSPKNDFFRVMTLADDIVATLVRKTAEAALTHFYIDEMTVGLEGYAFSRSGKLGAVFSLGELGGLVKLGLKLRGFGFPVIVTPGSIKKYACGKGNAGKAEVMMGVYKRWGIEMADSSGKPDDNLVDAWVIARILADAERAREGMPELAGLTQTHREVLKLFQGESNGAH